MYLYYPSIYPSIHKAIDLQSLGSSCKGFVVWVCVSVCVCVCVFVRGLSNRGSRIVPTGYRVYTFRKYIILYYAYKREGSIRSI